MSQPDELSLMTIEEFDARLEASNLRRAREIEEAEARNRELGELIARKEALLARLQTTFDEAKHESETINNRVAALNAASRQARKKNAEARLHSNKSSRAS